MTFSVIAGGMIRANVLLVVGGQYEIGGRGSSVGFCIGFITTDCGSRTLH